MSLSDKSTVDVMGNVDVDCATVSFCSSCAIPPPKAAGLWCLKGVRGGGSLDGQTPSAQSHSKAEDRAAICPAKALSRHGRALPRTPLVHQRSPGVRNAGVVWGIRNHRCWSGICCVLLLLLLLLLLRPRQQEGVKSWGNFLELSWFFCVCLSPPIACTAQATVKTPI